MIDSSLTIPGYEIFDKIYESYRTLVYRGERFSDGKKVIIKVLKSEYPTFSELIKFRNQYTLTKNLKLPGIIPAIALKPLGNTYGLIMEDKQCQSLATLIQNLSTNQTLSVTLEEFFKIALQLSDILAGLRKHHIIHKDIKPQNILINPDNQQVFLIDFSIATLVKSKSQSSEVIKQAEGTWAYMSPEQTGRVNQGIDYRTDFYSLGITFYELLTGQLPFDSKEPLQLVHCHLVHQPRPPRDLNPAIPQMVNDIILKLMAKKAEDRYQTPQGLKYDLKWCFHQYINQGKIELFTLGIRDQWKAKPNSISQNYPVNSVPETFSQTQFYLHLSQQELWEQQRQMFQGDIFHSPINQDENDLHHQLMLNLMGKSENPLVLIGNIYDESQRLSCQNLEENRTELFYLYGHKSLLAYLFEDYGKAWQFMENISPDLKHQTSQKNVAYLYWLESLIQLAIYPTVSPLQKSQILETVKKNQRKLKQWSKSQENSLLTKFFLIEAERYRLKQTYAKALEYYEQAINSAQAESLFLDLAVAYELAAKFYRGWGKEKIAAVYFTEAYYAYSHWGASAKAEALEKDYSQYLTPLLHRSQTESFYLNPATLITETLTSTQTSQSSLLDLETVIKASQTLSEQLHLRQLISTLIQVILENAGAQKCILILRKNDHFVIEAEANSLSDQSLEITSFLESKLLESEPQLPQLLIQEVIQTKHPIIIDHVGQQLQQLQYQDTSPLGYWQDPYLQTEGLQSMLCSAIQHQGQVIGVLYLENNQMAGAFSADRIAILLFLCSQAAICLENAQLYQQLENYSQHLEKTVEERTQALRQEIYERQLLEDKLTSSEGKIRASFEAMNDIILILDADATNIEVSPTRATHLQSGEADPISCTLEQFFLEDSAPLWLGKVQEALTTGHTINFDYSLKIGEQVVWFSANISPLPDNTVIWVARDITERQEAEATIRHSEEKFASAFQASPNPMTITTLKDGKHLEVNDSFLEITGYTRSEVIGKTALELNLWVNLEDRTHLFHLLETQGMIRNYEFESRGKFGQIRTALLSADIIRLQDQECLLSISNDITERKQREEAIRLIAEGTASQTGEDFFRAFVRHLAAALEVRYAVITAWTNPTQTRIRTLAMWMGTDWEEPFEYDVQETPCESVLNGKKCYYPQNIQQEFPKDTALKALAVESYCGMPMFDTNGQVLGHVAVLDVKPMVMNELAEIILTIFATRGGTELERKQAEDALRQSETDLKNALTAADAASKAKSEFLSKMSHELRTPLNAILGFTQVLMRNGSLNTTQQEQLGIISRSGEHLLSLINDVLEMSKIEAGQITLNQVTFDLYRLLDSIEEMLRIKADSKQLQLIFDQEPDVPQYIQTDEGKLRQVLINLIGNAIKFTEEGGVAVRVARGSEVPTAKNQIFVEFEIEDTGVGIGPHELDQLFDPFIQTESGRKSQEGTGLGLPISCQFVQLMGGEITVRSEVGKGTLFKFAIQAGLATITDIPQVMPKRRVMGLAPDQPTYRILVVEDRWESRLLLVNLLTSVGFSVQAAENGQEAIAIWEQWEPHLIWMDMRMPVMDGYAATQAIKSHLKGQATVIIALTASAMEEHRITVLSAGCDDFVRKPFREEVLFEKMAEYLGVRYVYEEQATVTSVESVISVGDLTPGTLATMSITWIQELHQAATEADSKQILQLVEAIPESNPIVAQTLIAWVNDFRFDKITDITEQLIHE